MIQTIKRKYNLDSRVVDDIIRIGQKNGIKKIILFGSRARGDNSPRSDIDLAVSGGNALDFYYDLEEDAWTLLMFDVVNLDRGVSKDIQKELDRDGVVLYEEV